MSNTRNLTHLSLECILPYMDPNLRIQLSTRCPNFNRIDSRKSMFIDRFSTADIWFHVNSTNYRLGIIKVYNNGETPLNTLKTNSEGGVYYDVDKYGFRVGQKVDLNKLDDLEYNYQEVMNKYFSFDPENPETLSVYQRDMVSRFKPTKDYWESQILPLKFKKYDLEPTYTHYLQLTISNESTTLIERVTYNRQLKEALDFLMQKFILPFKLKIKLLEIFNTTFLGPLQNVLTEPVRAVECLLKSWNECLIIKNAGKLIIETTHFWNEALKSNSRVHVKNTRVNPSEFIWCAQDQRWHEKHMSMEIENLEEAIKDIESARVPLNGRKGEIPETRGTMYPECVTFRIGENTDSHLYIEAIQKDDGSHSYALHVKNTPIGYATLLKMQ